MTDDRPNVLLFFTDQQRFDTIGALGNPVIRTPNLDRLRREGVAFTSAFSPSPVCVSARCALNYGRYPWNSQCYENGDPMPEESEPSLADRLAAAGYRTHAIGKCHFTPDPHALRGFQERETQEEIVSGPDVDDYLKHLHDCGFDHVTDPHGVRGEMYYVPQPAQLPAGLHPTQWIGDRTLEFVESEAHTSTPWFLFSSFIHPHPPFAPPAPWHKLYRAPLMPPPNLPPDAEALHTYINRRQNRYKYRDRGLDLNLLRCMKAYYYGCISFIDYQVGRVLDSLEQTGQLDRTLILFTSDHGEHLGDRGCFGKRSMHDSCARVPMLARLPGRFAGGQTCDTPASLVDVAPTALAAAGADAGAMRLDGVDLAELPGGAQPDRVVFSQHANAGGASYMAVNAEWKYFYSAPDDGEFLLDRVGDPLETRNRAGDSACRAARDDLRRTLLDTLRAGGEAVALDGDGWRRYPRLDVPADPDAGLLIQDHPWANQNLPGYNDGAAESF